MACLECCSFFKCSRKFFILVKLPEYVKRAVLAVLAIDANAAKTYISVARLPAAYATHPVEISSEGGTRGGLR